MHTSLRRGKSFRHLKKNLLQNISLPLKSFGKYFDKDMDKSLTHFCKLVSSSTTIFFRPVPTHVFIAAFSPRIFCNLVHSIIPLCHFCMEPLGKKKNRAKRKTNKFEKALGKRVCAEYKILVYKCNFWRCSRALGSEFKYFIFTLSPVGSAWQLLATRLGNLHALKEPRKYPSWLEGIKRVFFFFFFSWQAGSEAKMCSLKSYKQKGQNTLRDLDSESEN